MPHDLARVLQRDLFLGEAQAYRDALARYEASQSIVKRERPLAQPPDGTERLATVARRPALSAGGHPRRA
jgi:hypothetical protein